MIVESFPEVFARMRARALAEPQARAIYDVSIYGQAVLWRSARWSVILTVNR